MRSIQEETKEVIVAFIYLIFYINPKTDIFCKIILGKICFNCFSLRVMLDLKSIYKFNIYYILRIFLHI
jgi:hypothetical protein